MWKNGCEWSLQGVQRVPAADTCNAHSYQIPAAAKLLNICTAELTLINNHLKWEGRNWHFNHVSVAAVSGHLRRKTRFRINEYWEKTLKSIHDVKFVIVSQFLKDSVVVKCKMCTWRDKILSLTTFSHNRGAQIDNRQNFELVATLRTVMGTNRW